MIDLKEYQARRKKLAQMFPEGAVAMFSGADEHIRNGDAHYRFRQASDFYYLTGFNEPNAMLLIVAGNEGESYLFNNVRDPAAEQWAGKRLGQEGACQILGMQDSFPIATLDEKLPDLLSDKSTIYYALGSQSTLNNIILNALDKLKGQVRKGIKVPGTLCDIYPLLSEMRLFKSPAEIALMRRAADISVMAHKRAMRACRELLNEHQLEAELLYEFARNGCRSVAYDPIVGGGANACILHYTDNNQPLVQGELVLIDAAGEFENYAADITRTFPVNGRFSESQRQIYELVLTAQKAGIACIRPGVAWSLVQETIVRILTNGLCDLGILQGDVEGLVKNEAYKPFYMHNSGHWLGLDVHDSGRYKRNNEWRVFEPGMVLTVEPGLYIRANMPDVDERWWNIGVRIEDDILVTPDGHENLTRALPVDIADIEALMRD